ncbi:MAG TPA: cytochrome c oxidase subunit II [Anaerolineae bacterium]|nr:cytochrome c oxidase subunit II [Anaerolineae bacterium]
MKHIVTVTVLVIVATVLVFLVLRGAQLVPEAASAESTYVDEMFYAMILVISFVFSLIVVLMLYSIVVFRRKPGDTTDGPHVTGHTGLEITWTVVPFLVVMAFGVWGAMHLEEITAAEPDELEVRVLGFQFGWRFEYPDAGVTSNQLYLPVDRQTRFVLTSQDVIHSFWIPEFRIKQDAVPGMFTELRITPTEVGDYRVRCAELCGYAHAAMYAPVVVVEQQDFEAWLEGEAVAVPETETTPAERGALLSNENGCLSCHSIDGTTLVGPTWLGLYGSERPLDDGSTVTADDEYLHTAIVDPAAQIVQGFPNVMPQTYGSLPEEDIQALVEYIKSLGEE